MSDYNMETIHHNLDCNCHRRREWVEVNGKMTPIEFSVDNPNQPPMTEEEKQKLAKMIELSLKDLKK